MFTKATCDNKKLYISRTYDGIPITEKSKVLEDVYDKGSILEMIKKCGSDYDGVYSLCMPPKDFMDANYTQEVCDAITIEDISILRTPIQEYFVKVDEDTEEKRISVTPIYEIAFDNVLERISKEKGEDGYVK